MLKNEFKAKVIFFFYDSTFLFIYNIKITILNEFFDLELFYIDNFEADISMVIEIQTYF